MGLERRILARPGALLLGKCIVCQRPCNRRCDFKLSSGRACDASLCSACTVSVAPGVDRCPGHPLVWRTPAVAL